ncbi:hypothetical protein [Tardiphaga robiniae]|uniref:Uncharacterized protein n=1 Tax=Tardiphaga robiniae TaxID=943830 RepID=A0A7G6U2E5_9BRAD|nr:hypothetical protein [Tardiphaga robiniae]QND73177.1 hypothetical protein HB776_19670 [Tardiphaga robiniae]
MSDLPVARLDPPKPGLALRQRQAAQRERHRDQFAQSIQAKTLVNDTTGVE